jgi:hypothetical protein
LAAPDDPEKCFRDECEAAKLQALETLSRAEGFASLAELEAVTLSKAAALLTRLEPERAVHIASYGVPLGYVEAVLFSTKAVSASDYVLCGMRHVPQAFPHI